MKILHIVPSYLPAVRYGGPVQSVHNLNKWLAKLGAEVTVYTTNSDGPMVLSVPTATPTDMDGVKVIYFETKFPNGWYFSPDMGSAIKENIEKFDIVHITSTFLFASTIGSWYARKFNKPYVISPRGNLMREPLKTSAFKKKIYISILEKRNLKSAFIHFTSEEEKADFVSLSISSEGNFVIPNGIDNIQEVSSEDVKKFREKFNISYDDKVVVYLGRISKIKGFDILLPAFAEAISEEPELKLLVIGGDDAKGYKSEVERMVAKSGIKDRVIFAGMLSGLEKATAICAGDMLVQPSLSESFGMAAAEGASYGLPVIITKGVGLAELIKEKEAGLVVGYNAAALKYAILQLMRDASLRTKFGVNGKKMAIENLSGEMVAKKFIEEYNLLINEHARKKQ